MKKWFKRNGIELVLGIGLSLFFINYFTDQTDDLYILSIPLVIFGLVRMYQRHFGPRYYSSGESYFVSSEDGDEDDLYEDAKEAVIESGKALMDMLEEENIIGPAIGSTPREVLKKNDSE